MKRCLLGKGLAILALDLDHLDILEGIPGLGRSHIRRGGARQEKVAEDDHRIVAHQCQEEDDMLVAATLLKPIIA